MKGTMGEMMMMLRERLKGLECLHNQSINGHDVALEHTRVMVRACLLSLT
jgi:hypothetical protein